jgi:methanogenic corrinoid protein MtbC1
MIDDFSNQFVAGFLAGRAAELAGTPCTPLLERFPDTEARYRPVPRLKWRENLAARVQDLASCVAAESPALFGSQIAWSRAAFASRGVPEVDLDRSLRVLREVVLEQLTPEDAPVVGEYFRAGEAALRSPRSPESTTLHAGTPEGELGARYLLALLEGDRVAASRLVLDAVRDGLAVARVYTHVLMPVQRELGRLWQACELNVAEEHFATGTTAMVMAQLQAVAPHRPRDGRTLVVACAEGDLHDLGARMLADFFEMAGWRVIPLGASVPASEVALAASCFHADVVALSGTLPVHLDALRDAVRLVREQAPSARLITGGAVFHAAPGAWTVLGADGYAADISEALALADRLAPPRP